MNLPETLKIGPYTYTVSQEEKVRGDQNEELYGEIKYNPQTVRVQSGLSDDRTLAIVLHEALHGMDEYLALGLSEKQITRLGPALAAFVRDNPALWKIVAP